MKKFSYVIDKSNIDVFFPQQRIKNKLQILEILLEASRFLLYSQSIESLDKSKIILNIDKMSRLFFFDKKKYYSIIFPFTFIINEGKTLLTYKNIIDIDSKTISDLLTIIKDEKFNSSSCLDFIEPILELEAGYKNNLWGLLKDLLTIEDGYVRFDNDTEGYLKAKNEGNEHRHPENHLDIFYSNNNTFKIGLNKLSEHEEFIDYFDIKTDCKYLNAFQ